MTLSEFKVLYDRFIKGTRWLESEIKKNKDPLKLEIDKMDFRNRIADPMDKAWMEFSDKERAEFINQNKERRF